jgi:polyphosphate glucokinase
MAKGQGSTRQGFGVDIGGSGIKGAPVDLNTGELLTERLRIPTPRPATPEAIPPVVAKIVGEFGWTGPVGVTFPAVIKNGTAYTAANVDHRWIGADVRAAVEKATGTSAVVLNDADAAGIAEMHFGAGRDRGGVVVILTFGTGIGSAVFLDGRLVPNTELGHLEVDGRDAETRASDAARERDDLSWDKWAKRVTKYLRRLDALMWPDLVIIGGGVSSHAKRFLDQLDVRVPVTPAALQNQAGIAGAALAAAGYQVG